jgi:hypothetical protein
MDITCWNCKTVTKLDKVAVEAAIAKMTTTKLGFHDIVCAGCGKANRTTREAFDTALLAYAAPATVPTTKREATKKTKEENARRREDASKGAKKKK